MSKVTIPFIDISGYLQNDLAKTQEIVFLFQTACQNPGFLQITGHSISPTLRSDTLAALSKFFALPLKTKLTVHRNKSPCLRGYEVIGEQTLEEAVGGDQKEGFMIGPELPDTGRFLQGPNQWVGEDVAPGLGALFMEYFRQMHNLSVKVFRIVALSLGLEEGYFDEFVGSKDSIAMCRAHRYPPTTKEMAAKTRGIGAHTDFGALTLLLQDEERWTNNRYKSTRHRVISPVSDKDRYSIAFFNEGLLDKLIMCLPTCVEEGEEPLHEPITAEQHLRNRYGGTY
ncbi:hypothetical protein BJX66DRAFT_330453 [Aspergillus keveii]|uniref:Oxidoreductase, 2OG-Fe(II) oxygenase family n=1 Tax=Aspergillus keveii TaxID=714993 RepID=A0ABR4FKD7_9EURO